MIPTIYFLFTELYKEFYSTQTCFSQMEPSCIDCQDLSGVDCYCSEDAEQLLSERMRACSPFGIHFLGSGNYHYLTKLWLEKIHTPFSLILFDNHTDMQTAGFFDLLSCGSWLKYALETHPFLQDVLVIGPSEHAFLQDVSEIQPLSTTKIPKKSIHCISKEALQSDGLPALHSWLNTSSNTPIYLSIDKDILRTEDAVTNWDQGEVSLTELVAWIDVILQTKPCIGADICGEYGTDLDLCLHSHASKLNSFANQTLYNVIAPYLKNTSSV